jgi:hypothetical protein
MVLMRFILFDCCDATRFAHGSAGVDGGLTAGTFMDPNRIRAMAEPEEVKS